MIKYNISTTLCISLSARPGNTGTRFHNWLYEALGLNFVYLARTTENLSAAIGGIKALGIRGCGVSMPFKEACITLLDTIEASAAAIGSVNTIVNTNGSLIGSNTDYEAVCKLVEARGLSKDMSILLKGSGGMAKATAHALRDMGFVHGTIQARNEEKGLLLAKACDWAYTTESKAPRADIIVNTSPVGMAGTPESKLLAFSAEQIAGAQLVFDVVAQPALTPLIIRAKSLSIPFIGGAELMTVQALEQFVRYTGIRPDTALVEEAAAYSRQST